MSPRVKHATRLWALGLVKTKKDAAEAVGLHPATLGYMLKLNEQTQDFAAALDAKLADEAIQASAILQIAGRRAVGRIAHLMEHAKDDVALKAAIDLADRSPEMQKVQRLDVSGLSIGEGDAKAIAAALLESAHERGRYAKVAVEGLVEIQPDTRDLPVRALTGSADDRQDKPRGTDGDAALRGAPGATGVDGCPSGTPVTPVTSISAWLAERNARVTPATTTPTL